MRRQKFLCAAHMYDGEYLEARVSLKKQKIILRPAATLGPGPAPLPPGLASSLLLKTFSIIYQIVIAQNKVG